MTDFTVTITDPEQLAGITWAREQYNAAIPPPPPPLEPPPDSVAGAMTMPPPTMTLQTTTPIETDQDYVQWVMEQAAVSYADQKLRSQYREDYEEAAGAAGRKVI